jgi:predicted nucleic acid-binding Zn ribbon protein
VLAQLAREECDESSVGRRLARPFYHLFNFSVVSFDEKECASCGKPFQGRIDKAFCSTACRVRAHRQRQEETDDIAFEDVTNAAPPPVTTDELPWVQPSTVPVVQVLPGYGTSNVAGSYLDRWRAEEAAEAAEQQQRHLVALASEMHTHYVEAIEAFLDYEGQLLGEKLLQELMEFALDAREAYKQHPQLKEPDSDARRRLNDLRDAALVLRDTWQEAHGRMFSGRKASYDLPKKWRKKLRDRLLE